MSNRFNDKRALVTGGSRGIGKAIVKGLLAEGATVFALGKSQSNLDKLKAEFSSVNTIQVDLSDWESTRIIVEQLGVIDILVNNAGVFIPWNDFYNFDKEQIDYVINTNFKAAMNVSQVVSRGLISAGRPGAVVNVSSLSGIKAFKGESVYCISKAMMEMMTKCMALELGPHKIRVNSIQLTLVPTDMTVQMYDEEFLDTYLKRHPLGRFATVDDVVNTTLFLLSDQASIITGAEIPIDGGFLVT